MNPEYYILFSRWFSEHWLLIFCVSVGTLALIGLGTISYLYIKWLGLITLMEGGE